MVGSGRNVGHAKLHHVHKAGQIRARGEVQRQRRYGAIDGVDLDDADLRALAGFDLAVHPILAHRNQNGMGDDLVNDRVIVQNERGGRDAGGRGEHQFGPELGIEPGVGPGLLHRNVTNKNRPCGAIFGQRRRVSQKIIGDFGLMAGDEC